MTAFATFYKYRRICHPDITLQKLKEDMCDTCIKYKTMLDDENLNETDKENIHIALNVNIKLISYNHCIVSLIVCMYIYTF